MRITSGKARGILLSSFKDPLLRPATDFMRKAVFSSLGEIVRGTFFLDLFSGTGAYGLEALSSGARGGIFVEKHPLGVRVIEQNLKAVLKSMAGIDNPCEIVKADIFKITTLEERTYDLIFVDPPYRFFEEDMDILWQKCLKWLKLSENSRLVIEAPGFFTLPEHLPIKIIREFKNKKKDPAVYIVNLD